MVSFSAVLLLPLLACGGTLLIAAYGNVPAETKMAALSGTHWGIFWYAIQFFTLIWPLVVLRLMIGRHLARSWPNVAGINCAGMFALIALAIPYICSFSYLPYELASPGGNAGQGAGILLFLVVTPVAGVLAVVGWLAGLYIGKVDS